MSRLETNAHGELVVVIPAVQLAILGWRAGEAVTSTLTMSAVEGRALVITQAEPQTAAGNG